MIYIYHLMMILAHTHSAQLQLLIRVIATTICSIKPLSVAPLKFRWKGVLGCYHFINSTEQSIKRFVGGGVTSFPIMRALDLDRARGRPRKSFGN